MSVEKVSDHMLYPRWTRFAQINLSEAGAATAAKCNPRSASRALISPPEAFLQSAVTRPSNISVSPASRCALEY